MSNEPTSSICDVCVLFTVDYSVYNVSCCVAESHESKDWVILQAEGVYPSQ